MPQNYTIEDAPETKFTIGDDTQETPSRAGPQPSTWEKVKTGASDVIQGIGEGVLQPVATTSKLLNKIPRIGETLAPKAGVEALSRIATADPGHPLQTAGQYIPAVASLAEGGAEAQAAGRLVPFLKRAATGIVGGVVGSETGGEIGRRLPVVGGPTLGAAGEAAGGLVGTLAGGGAFGEKARNIGNPSEFPVVGKYLRKFGFPDLVATPEAPTTPPASMDRAFDLSDAERAAREKAPLEVREPSAGKVIPPRPQPAYPPSVRRVPGEVLPERVGAPPERMPSVPMNPPTSELPGGGTMRSERPLLPAVGETGPRPSAPARMPAVTPLSRLESLIQEAAGTQPLKPAIPLRNQMPQSLGAASEGFPPVGTATKNMGGPITFRREPIIKTVPGLEEGPLRAQPPEGLPKVATEEPARQMGAPPLQPAVPLRQQIKVTGMEPASKQMTLEQKYPDREIRQMVHANGEEMIDAVGNDRETMKAIHDLKNPDVRQALINSGEDMGQTSIGNRKATGNQMTRQDAFKKLLSKGYTPQQIVDLSKQAEEKPGPVRAERETRREKAGD